MTHIMSKAAISWLCLVVMVISGYTVDADIRDSKTVPEEQRTNGSRYNQLCPNCPVEISFGNLVEVKRDMGPYDRRPIDTLVEDRYNPGTFFFNSGHAVMKFTVGGTTEHFLGDFDQADVSLAHGNSTTSKFAFISKILQYNETIMYIGDYLNNCIRQYDYVTDLVTPFIGTCNMSTIGSRGLGFGESKPGDSHFMVGVLSFALLRQNNAMITLDHGYQLLSKYDYATKTVELLHPSLKQLIPGPYNLQINTDETVLYVVHTYGLSSVDLTTFEVRTLVGVMLNDHGRADIPFLAGPFSEASIGLVENLEWLVADELLVTTRTKSTQALVFFDLKGEQVYTACVGGLNQSETITGDMDVCELNSPTAVAVSQNRSIFVATLTDVEPDDYKFNANSSIYQLQTWASRCDFIAPTENEMAVPALSTFSRHQSVMIACPYGMAVASWSKNRTCEDNSKWNEPLPECVQVTPDSIKNISPTVGQLSGGTVVTVTGFIPDVGVTVSLQSSNGSMQSLKYYSQDQKITFTMPKQSSAGVIWVILKLSDDVEVKVEFEYLPDPVAHVERAATISSGGLDVQYRMVNVNSSSVYELKVADTNKLYECHTVKDMVFCEIGTFPNVTKEQATIHTVLYSDGVRLTETNVIVYPDPQFDKIPITAHLGESVELTGNNLDIGSLTSFYNITIQLSEDITVQCLPLAAKSELVTCLPNTGDFVADSEHKPINVKIGDYETSEGYVVFLPREDSITQNSVHSSVNIAIIVTVISCIVIAVIILAVVLYRRHKSKSRAVPVYFLK